MSIGSDGRQCVVGLPLWSWFDDEAFCRILFILDHNLCFVQDIVLNRSI
jgi:hypothetical protein